MTKLIFKILLLSTLLSVLVKYGLGFLSIQATTFNALIAIITPSLIMIILLFDRARKFNL